MVVVAAGLLLAGAWWGFKAANPAPLLVGLFMSALVSQFSSLTTTVRDDAFQAVFGLGLIRRRIPLGRIRDARAVHTPWYWGWGIRATPHGWLWRIWGLQSVEIEFDDGHRFRIGSDEPDRLVEALRSRQ